MKNVIFGIFGGFITIYTSILAIFLFQYYSRQNELSKCLSQTMEMVLDKYYGTGSTEKEIEQIFNEQICARLNMESEIEVRMLSCDMQKGILSVEVILVYPTVIGKNCKIMQNKTILVDKCKMDGSYGDISHERIKVSFERDGVMYKNYQIRKGSSITIPELNQSEYRGWKNRSEEKLYSSGEEYVVNEQVEFFSVRK